MKGSGRIKRFFGKKPVQQQPTPPADGPLREFVYLDDVSVDSLVQSVRAGTLDQVTESTNNELQSEIEGTIGASNLITSAEFKSRLQSTITDGSQRLRRVGIQARFGELHTIVWSRRVMRPTEDEPVPQIDSISTLKALADGPTGNSIWAVPVAALSRGDVIEVDVELGSEPLFHMVEAMHQMLELWPEDPQMVGLDELPDQGQAQAMSQMISAMLGGLVPIRSRALHFEVATLNGEAWLVNPAILDQLPPSEVQDRRPLNVVGAASQEKFWKDRRRVVFAGARYRVLARLVLDGTVDGWSPVKMVDTFKDFAPGFADGLNAATRQGELLLQGKDPSVPVLEATGLDAHQVVERFATELNERFGSTVTSAELSQGGMAPQVGTRVTSLEAARPMLDAVSEFVSETGGALDPQALSDARLAAYQQVSESSRSQRAMQAQAPALVEVEFIAIYW
jgi:hypothetical protein